MAKARIGICAAALALVALHGGSAAAQETIDQFNAANAENRRHLQAEQQLRNQAHDLRGDRARSLLNCQGAGAAQSACSNNAATNLQQRGLQLNNQAIQERNNHNQILKGIGVHRVP